ncbi:MAG: AAA family ATPase [Deltaproteobacteria bacterium]|nr:AAA family ATPase [Deltaproteobacteria bacterium]MCL5277943.1 AAA family ATPase [Deltaproteobacteria bacterium]
MIKKIHIKNYKSLKDVDLELNKVNVLVGPNMSGKSSLLDCFKFLSNICNLAYGVNGALNIRGGFAEIVWKGEESGPISFSVTVELAPDEYEYELSINGNPATGTFSVEREDLKVKTGDKAFPLIDITNGQGKVMHKDGRDAFGLPGNNASILQFVVPGWEGMSFKDYIKSWNFYNFMTIDMKLPNSATSQPFLVEDGSNFSSWFMTLQTTYPTEFSMIKQVVRDVLPDIEEILTPPTQTGTTHMITREKYLKRSVLLPHMSDGEILFLALLSLIFAPAQLRASLLGFEELENHLHPRLFEVFVELLSQRQRELGTQAPQIIITTHSPYLVDRFKLDDIVVIEKRNGATQCTRPASKTYLKKLLEREELGLGDLLYSGALGNDK